MCTVSFFKISEEHFILTSNRDEKILRGTTAPVLEKRDARILMFPKDLEKGGSWIAAGENGRIACLLNGAFEPHLRNPPYSKSRGIVLLDSFSYENIENYFENYNLENVEPFTLIIAGWHNSKIYLYEQRWDGTHKYLTKLDPSEPRLWSSASLYTKNMRLGRDEYFSKWNKTHIPEPQSILDFHLSNKSGNGSQDILLEGKYGLKTVSVTRLNVTREEISMLYIDRLTKEESKSSLRIL